MAVNHDPFDHAIDNVRLSIDVNGSPVRKMADNWSNAQRHWVVDCCHCVTTHLFVLRLPVVENSGIIDALRDETPLPSEKLEALRTMTLQTLRQRGWVSNEQQQAFFDAGYAQVNLLEIVLILAQKVLSNYVNHLAHTPVDKPFQAFAWEKKA